MNRRAVTLALLVGAGTAAAMSAAVAAQTDAAPADSGVVQSSSAEPFSPPSPLTVEVDEQRADVGQAPASFDADLDLAQKATNLSVGRPCAEGNETWMFESSSVLAPVAGVLADGECVVMGWSYIDSRPMDFELPQDEHGYVQQPIFDESGRVVAFFLGGEPVDLPNGPDGNS